MISNKVFKNYSKRDRFLSALLVGVIALVLTVNAVQSFIYNFKISDSSSAYTEGLVGELQVLNPLFRDLNAINRDLSSLIFSGLTKYNPDNKTFEPDLATFTINQDSTVYTFTLKDGARWHDGNLITAEDIMFTYRTVIQNPGFQNASLRQTFEGIEINQTTISSVEFVLPAPNSFFISQTDIGILPKHLFQDIPINDIGNEIEKNRTNLLIGSGPYTLNKIETLDSEISRVSLSAFRNYVAGRPKIRNLRIFIYSSDDALMRNQLSLNSIPNLKSNYIQELNQERFSTSNFTLPQYTALFLNNDNPIIQDRAIRVVLKRAANPARVIEGLENKQPVSRPFFQFEAIGEIVVENPQELREIIERNGWTLNQDQIYQKDGNLLEFNLLAQEFSQNEARNLEVRRVLSNLISIYANIGIKINARLLEGERFSTLLADRDYDIVMLGHNLGNNLDSYSFWHSSQANPAGLNLSNYRNIATDSLLERIRTTSDVSERNELIVAINEKLVYDVPAIFLFTDKYTFAFDNTLKNRKILTTYAFSSDRFYDISEWELN